MTVPSLLVLIFEFQNLTVLIKKVPVQDLTAQEGWPLSLVLIALI